MSINIWTKGFSVCCPWVNVAEFADADVDRAEKQNKNVGQIIKTFPFSDCNSGALHSTDCINSIDKEYNGQFYCLVREDVSLVSSQAQLKRHNIVKLNSFALFCLVGVQYIAHLMFLLYLILLNNAYYQFSVSALTLFTLLRKKKKLWLRVRMCVCARSHFPPKNGQPSSPKSVGCQSAIMDHESDTVKSHFSCPPITQSWSDFLPKK